MKIAALLSALLAAAMAPEAPAVSRPTGPEWLGVYLVGKKAGWARFEVGRERRDGRDVLVATSEIEFRVTVGDTQVERRQRDEKVYEASPGGRLLSFRSERSGDGGRRTVEGSCTPRACRATLAAEGSRPVAKELPPVPETVEQADAFRLAAARRATVAGATLDLDQLREKRIQDVFRGREKLGGAGVEVPVSVVAESEPTDRIPAIYRIADDGRMVEVRWGDSLVARAEPEAVAKRLDKVDIFNLSRVPLPGPLPQAVPGRIRFVLRGLPPAFQANDERQAYLPQANGDVAVIVAARKAAAEQPARDARRPVRATPETAELLAATPDVDADDPGIRRAALEAVGGERGVYAASRRILHWVFRRLEKVYGQSRDRASEVLETGKGDCTEHALLFLALARAAGIPARGVHGLVYARYADGIPALYWHAWVEVKSGGEWIAMDPTFDQPVADATHVALGRGTQADAVGLLGALAVLKAEPLPP